MSTNPASADDAGGQPPTPTPTTPPDPELEALTAAKAKAELRKAIAEAEQARVLAEKNARLAGLPTSETTGAAGSVTLESKGGYYAEVMAYETLRAAAVRIAAAVPKPTPPATGTVILTTDTDLSDSAQLWHLVKAHLDDIGKQLEAATARAQEVQYVDDLGGGMGIRSALLAAVPAILGAAADIVAFFRADHTLVGREVDLAESALVAEVAGALHGTPGLQVIVPGLALRGQGTMTVQISSVMTARRALAAERERVRQLVQPSLDQLARDQAELTEQKAALATAKAALEEQRKALSKLEQATPRDPAAIDTAREAIARLGATIAELEKSGGAIDTLKQEIALLTGRKTAWDALAASVDEVLTAAKDYLALLTTVGGDKPSPLATLRQVDLILSHPDATMVALEIVSQGAEVHTRKSVWSTRLAFVGGSVSVYHVVGPKDELIAAGSIPLALARTFTASGIGDATSPTLR